MFPEEGSLSAHEKKELVKVKSGKFKKNPQSFDKILHVMYIFSKLRMYAVRNDTIEQRTQKR